MPDAFKHMDGQQVPLVWQHAHNSAENILGHAILKATPEGVRADGYFNGTKAGQDAKQLVEHKDVTSLSIYANQLVEKSKNVIHGQIREVSLVLAGANPGAKIDFVNVKHSDGHYDELEDEAVITTGSELFHADNVTGTADAPTDPGGATVVDFWNSLSPEQQDTVAFIVEEAVKSAGNPQTDADGDTVSDTAKGVVDDEAAHTDTKSGEGDLSHKEGADNNMSRNVFDQTKTDPQTQGKHVMAHSETKAFFESAKELGSFDAALKSYALQHGIQPIDVLFPNFQNLDQTPQFLSRRMEWVQGVLDSTSKTPFSNVRSIVADITQDEARALGYIKGNLKKEEWFSVSKRTTTAATIYKKQKLDRDDIIDITDFDVVSFMKGEMMVMLKEEIARAILIGDGRDVSDPDKIKDPMAATDGAGIRSIINEHELYKTDVYVNTADANSSMQEVVETVLMNMRFYKGTGTPVFYTTLPTLTSMLLIKDTLGRRLYNSKAELASAMMVSDIITVEVMETNPILFGVIVNLADYNVGANRGGEINNFDFFDIDYNQYKYLAETRISGALTRPKAALVVWQTTNATDVLVSPTAPMFAKATGVVTVPSKTGVVYKNKDTGATLTSGAQAALTAGQTLTVQAVPASGYYFATDGLTVEWSFSVPPTP
jgi:hypothetical protein